MSWSLTKKPETVKATAKLAREFAEMEPCPHDRNVKPRILAMLNAALESRQFRTCLWAKAHCREDGKTYRVNGKHTSTVLSGQNGDAVWPFIQVEEYECDTIQDVADLYCTFDPNRSGRTAGDVNRVYLATHPELSGVPSWVFSLAVSGISIATWTENYKNRDPRERALLTLEHPGFVLWLDGMLNGKESYRMLKKGAVVAAMFQTWKKSQKAAAEFWTSVRDGTGSTPDCPDRKLQRYLLSTTVLGGNFASGKPRADNREFYVRCVHAWNAWRRNEKTDLRYHASAKLPAAA